MGDSDSEVHFNIQTEPFETQPFFTDGDSAGDDYPVASQMPRRRVLDDVTRPDPESRGGDDRADGRSGRSMKDSVERQRGLEEVADPQGACGQTSRSDMKHRDEDGDSLFNRGRRDGNNRGDDNPHHSSAGLRETSIDERNREGTNRHCYRDSARPERSPDRGDHGYTGPAHRRDRNQDDYNRSRMARDDVGQDTDLSDDDQYPPAYSEVERNSRERRLPRHEYPRGNYGDAPRRPQAHDFVRSHVPVIKPEIYDGSADWESYFSHFNNCADLGRWSDEEKALTLASCLQGSARTFYLGLQQDERRIFRMLVRKLSDRFGSKKQQSKYIARLESRKREAGETPASFGDDLRIMAQRAYPTLGSNAQESLALHQFYKAISPEMKCRCLDRECRTIQQAVDVVERYELVLGHEEKRRGTVRMVKNTTNNSDDYKDNKPWAKETLDEQMKTILMRLDKMEARLNYRTPQQADKQWPRKRYTGCYNCKSMDHYANECPEKTHPKNRSSENSKPLA